MKVAILAGGLGTRISEETDIRPKPMVQIGGKPIIWHIMKHYSHYGYNDFVILLGYKGYTIKEYFANYFLHQSDVTIDISNNRMEIHNNTSEPWNVTLVDTGADTQTGGRVKRAEKYLKNETFMLTYGDGLSDVNLRDLEKFHRDNGKLMTLTTVQPEGRFGALDLDGAQVRRFAEKPKGDGSWINGGFFVCEPKIFEYIKDGDSTILERAPLENLAGDGQLVAYKHENFWKPMDTLRDKMQLEQMWTEKKAPWKVWK